jgi:hypothetical protein
MTIWDVFKSGAWAASFLSEAEARQYVRRSAKPERYKVVESAVRWEQVGEEVRQVG